VESAQRLQAVVDAATSIVPPGVVIDVAATAAAGDLDQLFPEEERYIASGSWAVARQREFAAARICARRALERLGAEPCALVPHPDRSPRWPEGIVGSITHTRELCLVAVARRARLASIGVDVERVTAARQDIEQVVCTQAERRWLDMQAPSQRRPRLLLLFSAKEAFYKCQHPLTKTFLEFQDVELAIDDTAGTFSARIVGTSHLPLNRVLAPIRGRWVTLDDLVIAAAALTTDA
jgi:4'-phosphopantetheinyl transferase EntD